MKAKRKAVESAVGEAVFGAITRKLQGKSVEEAERVGERIGKLLMKLGKKRYETAVSNLRMAMPERDDHEQIAKACFIHFGRLAGDFLTLPTRSQEEIIASVDISEVDVLQEAWDEGKGVIGITGHFGNWERLAAALSFQGYPINVVARDANQTGVNGKVNNIRRHSGVNVIARGNAVRPVLEALKRNELVGILPDQNSNEIYIPFFGHPAGTVLGPGVIHERTKSPVATFFGVRTGVGQYRLLSRRLEIGPPTETKGESTMIAIHKVFEEVIREFPEQWLWFHDRWRNARRKGLIP